jgi:thiol-disulfide isomerase/thioredoxin
MKKTIMLALLLALAAFPALTAAQDTLAVGGAAPTFFLPALDGSRFFLSDHIGPKGGKTVVLDFFTTWCKPCKKELPLIDSLVKRYPRDSVLLVLVDVGEKRDSVLANFDRKTYQWPLLLDQFNAIGEKYGVKSFPTLFVIGPDGILRYSSVGYDERKGVVELRKILDQLVLKKGIKGKKSKKVKNASN